jgi:hypothetical protein
MAAICLGYDTIFALHLINRKVRFLQLKGTELNFMLFKKEI